MGWTEIGVIVLAVIRIAEVVAKWTKTDKDDIIVAKISSFVAKIFSQS